MRSNRIKLVLTAILLLVHSLAYAQENLVTGKVLDSKTNETLIGVVVTKKGTEKGTVTDFDGNFRLEAKQGDVLTISYLGFENQEITASSNNMLIKLQSLDYDLGDVVVVGVRMKKSDLTGAVGSISMDQIRETPTTDLLSAMKGRVPGLNIQISNAAPGSDMSVRVRGNNSIHHGQNPVYVIDGIVIEEGLRMVNPDDIESIEVLKDASSTALYGSRASNGVIVITTKKGKKGEGKVNYRGFVTISSYQDRMKTLNARETMELRAEAYANGHMNKNPNVDREIYLRDTVYGTNNVFSAMELENGWNNRTSNWVDELTRTGIEQNHSLSFAGASDGGSYYLGFTYSNNEGILKNSSYERFGGRINIDRQIKPWLKVGTNTSISRGVKAKLTENAYEVAMKGNKMQTIDRELLYMYYQGVAQMGLYNPLLSLDVSAKETHDRIITTNFVEINPLKGLYLRTSLSADIYDKQDNSYTPSHIGQSMRDNNEGIAWQWRGQTKYYQWDNSASYDRVFAKKHRLFGMVSSSVSKNRSNSIELTGRGYPTDLLGANNVGMAENVQNKNIGSEYKTNTLVSFVSRVNYTYDNKYMLTATVRADGSSKFSKGNKWGAFPSFSGAWTISEEKFMSETRDWLEQLKLRVGYGILGNQGIPLYSYLTKYEAKKVNDLTGFYPVDNYLGNMDIKWEKQKQVNLGLDASFFNDRLSFAFDYFHMNNSDLLMNAPYWPSRGYSGRIANVGELENQGVEFSIVGRIVETKDFGLTISGNIAHDKNKIKRLVGGVDVLWKDGNVQSRDGNLIVGQSINSLWGYKVDRLATEDDMDMVNGWDYIQDDKIVGPGDLLPVDVNGDNKIDINDMIVLGKTDPKFYGGFSSNFRYKDFSLDAVFTYSYGAKKTSGLYEAFTDGSATGAPAHVDMLNRWTPENQNTDVPRAFRGEGEDRFSYSQTNRAMLDASYLRLSTLGVAYNLGNHMKIPYVSSLSVNAAANNLFIITPYKGYDPEAGEGYPISRSFTVGLNLSF